MIMAQDFQAGISGDEISLMAEPPQASRHALLQP